MAEEYDSDYCYDDSEPKRATIGVITAYETPRSCTGNYEWVDRQRYEDKRGGNYSSITTREKYSTHNTVEKGTGRVGVKEEHKVTITHNFGNKSTGFSGRHVKQEKSETVKYGGSSKKYLA